MTFDLIVWPVDRELSTADALAEVERFGGRPSFLGGHDKRLDAFIEAIEARYPGIRRGQGDIPCEFDVMRDHIFLGISWSRVEEVVQVVAEAAWRTGVAVYDPQREAVGLPAPFAGAPMTSSGVEPHVAQAETAFDAIERGAAIAAGADDATVQEADLDRAARGRASASRARWGSRSRPTSRTRCGPTRRACRRASRRPRRRRT